LEPIETTLGILLRQKGLTLSLAESCTGGLVADRLTNIPGSSEYLLGGIVAYAYEAKVALLGVSWDTLHAHGAVSRETVLEMAVGARQAFNAHLALSISGVAGPGGGMPGKPVGYTWFGLATPQGTWARNFTWNADRRANKAASAEAALQFLLDYLQNPANLA